MPRSFPVIPGAEAWSHPGEGARPAGVVVVHGFPGNPVSTRPLGEALARQGHAVEVLRLPGHGTSWRELAGTRYSDWRAAVDAAFGDLSGRCRSVVLVGQSAGGTLCLDIAAARCRAGEGGQALAGVATINALVLDRPDLLARLAPILQYVLPVVPARAVIAPNDIAAGGDEKAYAYIPGRAATSITRNLPRVRRDLADITVPALVAHSPRDHTVAPENAAAIVERLGTHDITELRLERSFHVATLDYDAELLADAIAGFVARVTAG